MNRDLESRAHALAALAAQAGGAGAPGLSDDELLRLLAEHRWAIGRLAKGGLDRDAMSALNAAVLRAHAILHRRPQQRAAPFTAAVRLAYRNVLVSAIVFLGAAALAATAVLADPVVAFNIVPRELLAQIDQRAWGERSGTAADLGMTLFYWSNNLRASFLALGLGVLGGLPAMLAVAFNGAMLGAVAAIAIERGVASRFWAWIAPHGVPEISALILSGGIGLTLGLSWLEPGARARRVALAEAGRAVVRLVLVATVLIICAAPLEGFVAPLELPMWADSAIAAGWLLLLAGLGVWGFRRQRSGSPTS
jgi:uncharacterized membrane protein SpoIIM required for sporulation